MASYRWGLLAKEKQYWRALLIPVKNNWSHYSFGPLTVMWQSFFNLTSSKALLWALECCFALFNLTYYQSFSILVLMKGKTERGFFVSEWNVLLCNSIMLLTYMQVFDVFLLHWCHEAALLATVSHGCRDLKVYHDQQFEDTYYF